MSKYALFQVTQFESPIRTFMQVKLVSTALLIALDREPKPSAVCPPWPEAQTPGQIEIKTTHGGVRQAKLYSKTRNEASSLEIKLNFWRCKPPKQYRSSPVPELEHRVQISSKKVICQPKVVGRSFREGNEALSPEIEPFRCNSSGGVRTLTDPLLLSIQ